MSLALLFHHLLETLSKTHYALDNSKSTGHCSNQYLQKQVY